MGKHEPLIDIRERYYAGISESQWIDWITSSIPVSSLDRTYSYSREEESIMDNTRLGSRKVIEIIKTIANRYGYDTPTSFRYQLHKNLVLKVLKVKTITISEGEFININKDDFYEQICQYLFKPDRNRKPKTYFQNTLFPGLTVDQIWDIFAIPHKKLT